MTPEDYKIAQKACNFEVGDLVKVTHRAGNRSGGWSNSWADKMDDFIGNIYPINKLLGISGVTLLHPKYSDAYSFPYSVLQKVEKVKTEKELKTGVIISCGNVVEEVFFSEELLAEMKAGNKLILNTTKL